MKGPVHIGGQGNEWADRDAAGKGVTASMKKQPGIVGAGIALAIIIVITGMWGINLSMRQRAERAVDDEINRYLKSEWKQEAVKELSEPNLANVLGSLKFGERPVSGTFFNTIAFQTSDLFDKLPPEDRGFMLMRMTIPFESKRDALMAEKMPWAEERYNYADVTITVGKTRYVATNGGGEYTLYDETNRSYTSNELNDRLWARSHPNSPTVSATPAPSGAPSSNPSGDSGWYKRAGDTTGYDWATMSSSQKADIVDAVIRDWKATGFQVNANSDYFITGLNAFYGSSATDDTNLAEAMTMLGIGGGAVKR